MLNSLRNIVQEVNAARDLQSALNIIVARIKAAMHTQVCSVYLRNDQRQYVLMATDGLHPKAVGKVSLKSEEGLVGRVVSREEPLNLEHAETHPSYQYFPETGEERFSSFLGVPIIHHREVLGVLVVQQVERRRFDEGDEAFLVTLSAQLAGVIAHAEATGVVVAVAQGKGEAKFIGTSGCAGVAIGEAVVISPPADLNSVPYQVVSDIEEETAFFYRCLGAVRDDIRRMGDELRSRLSREEQALFDAYLAMLDDASLGREVIERINQGVCAPYAWAEVILEHERNFSSMNDAYLRDRAADVRDLGRRVLAYLQESAQLCKVYPDNTILVGEELTASMLGEVPAEKLAGLVSVEGSRNSHVAILARAMDIPTVMGAIDLPYTKLDQRKLIVDGYNGIVYADPSKPLKAQYKAIFKEEQALQKDLETLKDKPCETTDGHRLRLWVNTGLMADVMRSLDRGAEGVGLYRTEVPFLLRDRFPGEAEQTKIYREQLAAFAPRSVTMRTLDVGGDKALPYFPIDEANPFLGWRGLRVTLDHPEIFLVQVRAMLKASEGYDNLRIMLPMVTNIPELEAATALIKRAFNEVMEEGHRVVFPPVGVMVEVPAAVYQAREFAARSDFLSVGSNDLTQYLLAVDRNNARVADIYQSMHPAVLRALIQVVEGAHAEQVDVSICGEMAGDPGAAVLLMAMGFDVLSMSATNLPKVKSVLRAISKVQAEDLLAEVMQLCTAEEVEATLNDRMQTMGIKRLYRPNV
ncbi:phosphoenolpyruvate--protein phosphotransferase [Simiduia sp. 21SJ11W-1]|uniref:phosphoenolpyruvate--protein phosphotransferase n=1 Tax=Simiduia sp. 21SJ11W-1 TaxID=2909669 RepID=UPI0020A00A69|nr:phosphoenolpyruvate--protein phosphotransferase [Simiduia sp. 21SJ11W-1]UTA48113.1 phosphoenolpyruvate--protein phosphotransferase [Simiduia sp. 21SJ11W-1]